MFVKHASRKQCSNPEGPNMINFCCYYTLNLLCFQILMRHVIEGPVNSKNTYKVVDALQDAVVGKSPKV